MGKHGFQWKGNGGGFNYDEYKRKLDRVTLPDKVLCKICSKICNTSKFSKRQLEELRKVMANNSNITGLTRPGFAGCRTCISHQTVELTCSVCDKTMALEFFSKNQRNSPDTARCKNCVQDHLDAEPIAEVIKELDDGESVFESTAYQSSLNEQSLSEFQSRTATECGRPRNLADMDETASRIRTQTTRMDQEDEVSMGAGVWVEQGRHGSTSSVAPSGEGIEFVAYDNQGTPHARTAFLPARSVTGQSEAASDIWNTTTSRRAAPPPRRNSNFAKITGVRVPKYEGPNQRVPEPTGPTVESSDDSDEEFSVEKWI